MKVNLPVDLLSEGSPKTFREYSEWQSTEKSLALYLIQFCQHLRRQISLLAVFLPPIGRDHYFNLNQNLPIYNDLNFHILL
jgi:hypothetical protein